VGVEIQALLCGYARSNLIETSFEVVCSDIRHFLWQGRRFDTVFCNPPYFPPGSGKLSPCFSRAVARHCLEGTSEAWIRLFQGNEWVQRFSFILPAEAFEEWLSCLKIMGWHPSRILAIRPYVDHPPALICCETTPKVAQSTPEFLVLYRSHRVFTDQASHFFDL
jgi:tRNA1(Val) A37 N6-methylase TrmN6